MIITEFNLTETPNDRKIFGWADISYKKFLWSSKLTKNRVCRLRNPVWFTGEREIIWHERDPANLTHELHYWFWAYTGNLVDMRIESLFETKLADKNSQSIKQERIGLFNKAYNNHFEPKVFVNHEALKKYTAKQ